MLDFITEVTTGLENEIYVKNKEMSIYIEQVKEVTKAAIAVENDTFELNCLDEVASRDDSLGTLARVFQIRFLDNVIVKGRQKVTSLYEVLDAEEEKAIDLKLKTQKDFDRALKFYQKGEWAEAQDYFQKVLNTHAGDKVALLYLDRIETLKNQINVKTWDGVWHFTQK